MFILEILKFEAQTCKETFEMSFYFYIYFFSLDVQLINVRAEVLLLTDVLPLKRLSVCKQEMSTWVKMCEKNKPR